ncbi:MAG: amino acid permease [Solobacterium sp.]|nr:amino acid permease [Solobacterium sp.]
MSNPAKKNTELKPYLTPLGAWALAFGCSVGWGAFVMPGTTFLPIAGPVGTVIGVGIGGIVMLIIGVNYHFLMNRFPGTGGTYSYTRNCFGYDHGFLSAWFLILTYVAIIWANATALPLIARNLFGGLFQFGFHYQVAGFDVYFGELLLANLSLLAAGLICLRRKAGEVVQILMALVLFGGITLCFARAGVFSAGSAAFTPAYPPETKPLSGIITIIALAPWAFSGFESISHSTEEFAFSGKKSLTILLLSVVMGAAAYIMLVMLAASVLPEGCSSWWEYISNLGSYSGVQGLPTFFAAETVMGKAGTVVLGFTTLGAIMTGLVGNYVASSRLIYTLAKDDMVPDWFRNVSGDDVPDHAILFIMIISMILPFLGRTAISWIVDVTTVGATIAYGYASGSALKTARREGNRKYIIFGIAGGAIAFIFMLCFLIPNLMAVTALSRESYLILAGWSLLGFVYFLYLFRKDHSRRLGHSVVTWVVLLGLVIFTSSVWMRQATEKVTSEAMNTIQQYYAEESAVPTEEMVSETIAETGSRVTANLFVQTGMIVAALIMLLMIYSLMQKRQKQMEVEKALAEENSRAKTSFLSNMSHEIRTPMNAIIGLDNIALKDPDLTPHTREQLEKIGASARHLLGLINDILDMSRIESGRMVLKDEEFCFRDFMDQINIMINGQCVDKGLTYDCHIIGHVNDYYIGDVLKLKQVLINILGNAVKFTNPPGSVTLSVEQTVQFEDHCTLRFIIKDTGIGMSREYIPKIFDAFSQENNTAANKYGSTGLGMAITKNIVEMMNGDIEVESEKGVGTEFTVTVTLKASARNVKEEDDLPIPASLRLLVVDDDPVASEHAQLVANAIGINADTCGSGEEALELLRKEHSPYEIVLTDYRMPGMNGIEFASSLHQFDGGKTAVIIMTGYNWNDIQKDAKEAGVEGIISKPIFTDTLLREVRNILHARETGKEAIVTPLEETPAEGSLAGLHVLIAEDIELNAEILTDILDLEGISAEHAENGRIAMELFRDSAEHRFDAILMDVRMPEMDGLEATRAIRALDRPDAKQIPIIAMTANAFDEDVQRSLQAGMNAHLSKPVEPERLFETLRRLVKGDEQPQNQA